MKKLIISILMIFVCMPLVAYGQNTYSNAFGHGQYIGIDVVEDTVNLDKTKGNMYYFTADSNLYVADGTYLDLIIKVNKDGVNGQVLMTDGNGNFSWTQQTAITWYGVSWDAKAGTDTYTRLGTLADSAASADIPDALLSIQASMERWVIDNAGNELYQLDPANSNKKITGETISLTGTNGQVVVKVPKFYYYFHYDASDSIFTWKISQDSIAGFVAHPAFFKDSVWVDYRYIGAYEASMWDNSVSGICDSANIPVSIADIANDSLCSIACGDTIYPKTNEQRTEYRAMAANRGSGWRLMTYYDQSMIQLLYLVEYADFNSQSKIGNGRTALSGLSWVANSYIGKCGMSDGDGNFSGNVSPGDSATSYMSYRGIENWYGNIWKMLDGIVWDASANDEVTPIPVWASNHRSYFLDNTTTGMVLLRNIANLGSTDDDYQYYLENISSGFLPSAVGGSSSTRQGDYYWQYPDNGNNFRLVLVGASALSGLLSGGFSLYADHGFTYANAYFGVRVCF